MPYNYFILYYFILDLCVINYVLFEINSIINTNTSRVPCSPWDPRFAGSNPAEGDGFFQDVEILSTSPPGGTLS